MKRRDARALDHKTLQEIRIRAVERVQAGESPEAVIQALGFTRSCIYTWLARYRSGGWGGLQARALEGRPMKIQADQMRWLYRSVTGKSPLQFRFEFALWTREMIRVVLREQFDLKLSVASVGRLLKQLGLSCQRPLFRALEQDPTRVRRWLKREYPLIRRQARAVGADIYFGDEAGVRSDNHAGTTWGIKGQTPVVRSTGQRSSVNMISAVSARGHMRFMLAKGRVNGAVFVEFLKRLMHHAGQPIFLILDGGSYHHSRLVKDYVASLSGKLRLFFLPPYSPELNPDEQVWNYLKHHGVAKAGLRSEKREQKRDSAMHQTRKGRQWYFGMKAHVGVDSKTKMIHSVVATAANVADSTVLRELLHGEETKVWGDQAYRGQTEAMQEVAPGAQDMTHKQYRYKNRVDEIQRAKNRTKSRVRSKVEHVFGVMKLKFGFVKVRYRGLKKNANRLFATCALVNLFLVRKKLLYSAA